MRGVEDPSNLRPISYGLTGEKPWHDVEGVEMPWFLVVQVPPTPYVEAHMYANRLRLGVEVSLRLVGGKYAFMSDATFFQLTLAGSLTGQYGLVRPDGDDIPDELKLYFLGEMVPTAQAVHAAALVVKDNRTRMALAHFRRGYSSGGNDTLIDHWIGLEALFGDGSGEITYKAAMRIARYVGHGAADRRFLFRTLKGSYDARSALVHGAQPTARLPARLVASHALRASLLSLLLAGGGLDIKALDDTIAAAGA